MTTVPRLSTGPASPSQVTMGRFRERLTPPPSLVKPKTRDLEAMANHNGPAARATQPALDTGKEAAS